MNYSKGALLLKKLYSSVSSSFVSDTKISHLYIVEPLSAMVRIALQITGKLVLKFQYQNKIGYSDPTMLQGTIRWSYGDTEMITLFIKSNKKGGSLVSPKDCEHSRVIFKVAD